MKYFMVVDGAQNSTFDIFEIDEAVFDIVFPNHTDIAFLDEVDNRVKESGLDDEDFFNKLYANKVGKKEIKGLHGILHTTGSPCQKEHFPTRKESDVAKNRNRPTGNAQR